MMSDTIPEPTVNSCHLINVAEAIAKLGMELIEVRWTTDDDGEPIISCEMKVPLDLPRAHS